MKDENYVEGLLWIIVMNTSEADSLKVIAAAMAGLYMVGALVECVARLAKGGPDA